MGGWATVEVDRTANGVHGTRVICGIKGLGGWWCINTPASTTCKPLPMDAQQTPSRWLEALTGEVLPVLESGTVAQMQRAVATFQASPLVQAELAHVDNSQLANHDQVTTSKDQKRHKSHKQHGAKHGKGRKH
jgi:hypothetical protein